MPGPGSVNPAESDIIQRLAAAGLKPPRAATLAVSNRCNLSCSHCWPDSGSDERAPVAP